MESIIFDNVELREDCEYVLYVGQLKTLCLVPFALEYLSRENNKSYDFLAIVSDAQSEYPRGNVIAINPLVAAMSEMGHDKVSWRISDKDFFTAVSRSKRVNELIDQLLKKQKIVNTIVYDHSPQFTLGQREGLRVIAPKADLAHQWNSKLHQFRVLEDIVPIAPTGEYASSKELKKRLPDFAKECPLGMFVCTEYGAAGANSFIAKSAQEVISRLGELQETIRVSKYLAHNGDPTVLAVVANERDVFVGAIADQNIVDGNKFRGSNYPSKLSDNVQKKLREYTTAVGRKLGESGYRGIFGCDYISNENGDVHFVEVNARKQGTTMEMTCTLENCLPKVAPTLLEMEYWAVTKGRFPDGWQNWEREKLSLHWGTHNFKLERDEFTVADLPATYDERTLFASFCNGKEIEGKHIVLEHPGAGYHVKQGTFLARIVALGQSHDEVAHLLELGKKEIEMTLKGRS